MLPYNKCHIIPEKKYFFSRFDMPQTIIRGGASSFCSRLFHALLEKYEVIHSMTTSYPRNLVDKWKFLTVR